MSSLWSIGPTASGPADALQHCAKEPSLHEKLVHHVYHRGLLLFCV